MTNFGLFAGESIDRTKMMTYNYHMRQKSVSSLDVAKQAGVSQATVSYVLNKRKDHAVAEATRERVLAAAQELNYRPNRLANGVLRGKTNIIGVLSAFLNSDFHASVLRGVCEVLNANDYHTFIAWPTTNPEGHRREIDLMLEHRVDGLLWMSDTGQWLRETIASERVPCVIVDDRMFTDVADCVVSDDVSGARLAIEHLISLGHRRIAFWSRKWEGSSYFDRLKGYTDALNDAGIGVDRELFVEQEEVRRMAVELHRLLRKPNPPTAIFCINDIPAMHIKLAAIDTGVRVPEDIAIVGYSNQDYAEFNDLTTVSQNSIDMGRSAARSLLRRIADPMHPLGVEYVPTELVIRGSTVIQPRRNRFDPIDGESL